ncbi:MAG: transglutaminase-like domain-containing protein [Cellulomonas sp.]|nr:transglutaminase-like domain-containing protein [Cellulomonas sp.]
MRARHAGWLVVDVIVLVAALALALSPLPVVFGGSTALPALGLGLAAGTALGLIAGWQRWPALVVTVLTLAIAVLGGGPLIGTSALPTPGGVRTVTRALVGCWSDVLTLSPPIGRVGDVLLAPFVLALVGAVVAVTVTMRARRPAVAASAGAVPVVVLVVSLLLGTAEPPIRPAVAGAVLGVVLLVWACARAGALATRRRASAAALTVLVLVGGVGLAPQAVGGTARFVLRNEITPPFDPADYSSPLAAFRSFVKADDEVLFTVSGLPSGARVRLATLDRYDGTVWNVAGGQAAEGSGEFRRVGDTIATDATGSPARVTFTIEGLHGVWLPTVGQAESFSTDAATSGELRYNDATGAAVLTGGLTTGTTYTVDTVVPPTQVPDAEIGDAASADVVLPQDSGVPTALESQALQVARDAGRPVQQARALATWLTETGYFSHGLTDNGGYPSLAGHGAARMTQLLGSSPMVGDGEQYASALALMARSLQLKARVVLGFVPGAGDAATAAEATSPDGTIEVRAKDVQAWVEVAFAGHGWVAFDATPATTRTPTQDQQDAPSEPQPQVVQPPLPVQDPVTSPQNDSEQPQTDAPPDGNGRSVWLRVLVWGGAGLLGLLLLASPVLLVLALKARRHAHRRRAARPEVAVAGAWDELVDTARDLRVATSPVATRTECARDLAERFEVPVTSVRDAGPAGAVAAAGGPTSGTGLRERLVHLAVRADRAVFAPDPPTPDEVDRYWGQVDEAVADLRGTVPWRGRARAAVSLRSLRDARKAARTAGRRP